jgi:hypothetical protein
MGLSVKTYLRLKSGLLYRAIDGLTGRLVFYLYSNYSLSYLVSILTLL